jgi:membrane-bound lytic murein transglycosylase MltF
MAEPVYAVCVIKVAAPQPSVDQLCRPFQFATVPLRRLVLIACGLAVAVSACSSPAPAPQESGKADATVPSASPAPAPAPASTPAQPADTAGGVDAPSDEAIATFIAPWRGDLDGIVSRRYLRILVTFSRTNYFLDKGEQRGATYEAGKAFETFLNKELKTGSLPVSVAFIPVRHDQVLQALVDGKGDLAAANLTITPERQALVDFSAPLVQGVREVLVTGPGGARLSKPEDLSGREVHVRKSSSYYASVNRVSAELQRAGQAPIKVVAADEQLEDEDLLEMVNAGLIPATVIDNHLAAFWAQVFEHLQVHDDVVLRADGQIAWALRKGSPKMKAVVDAFTNKHGQGSLLGNVILKRYLKSADYVKNAADQEERRKFNALIPLFRTYGDQYDLPWLLLAAQGYQESQLDQNRRSSAGAVGVMQIKPSTASGPPVFITGVDRSAQRNIEAGAKYLRFLVDQYYKDEPMDRVTKGLFALASYNAGPARVAGLRRKAERQGLDRNLWFQNVEIVAAREIGRETVQYVANIYKYYVAYQLLLEQRRKKEAAGT